MGRDLQQCRHFAALWYGDRLKPAVPDVLDLSACVEGEMTNLNCSSRRFYGLRTTGTLLSLSNVRWAANLLTRLHRRFNSPRRVFH